MALELGEAGELYNVASGRSWSVAEVVEVLRGLARVDFDVAVEPSRLRLSDVPLLVGDASRLRARTGWEPRYRFEETMGDLLDHWRERLVAGRKGGDARWHRGRQRAGSPPSSWAG